MSPGVQRRQPSPNGDTHLCLVLRHANVLFLIHSRLQISHLTVEVDERTLQDVSMLQEGSDSALKFTVMKFKHAAIVLSAGHRSSTLKDHPSSNCNVKSLSLVICADVGNVSWPENSSRRAQHRDLASSSVILT